MISYNKYNIHFLHHFHKKKKCIFYIVNFIFNRVVREILVLGNILKLIFNIIV